MGRDRPGGRRRTSSRRAVRVEPCDAKPLRSGTVELRQRLTVKVR
jgi:hypothetical protein